MQHKSCFPVLLAAVISLVACDRELQAWSLQLEEGVATTLECAPTNIEREPQVFANSSISWSKHGVAGQIINATLDGVKLIGNNLEIDPVNADSAGIYFCHVYDATNTFQGKIVKGLNVNGPKKTGMDKYRNNVITGIITGAVVCALVCTGCFIDHFRYRSPEQKQKIQDRKQERLARQERLHRAGADNPALETDEGKVANGQSQEDTHL